MDCNGLTEVFNLVIERCGKSRNKGCVVEAVYGSLMCSLAMFQCCPKLWVVLFICALDLAICASPLVPLRAIGTQAARPQRMQRWRLLICNVGAGAGGAT